jgi:uncharacterized tellurite resistance protein B-like protein
MMSFIKKISRLLEPQSTDTTSDTGAIHINSALASLLFEAARVDRDVTNEDLTVAAESLSGLANISIIEAQQLLVTASEPKNRPTSYHPLATIINGHLTYEQKCRLIASMWSIAHSDDYVDPHEDHIIRKISDLLYVAHQDFIHGKISTRKKKI